MRKIRVWDLPTRLFHWSLAILVIAAIVTEKIGGVWVEWHFRIGYAVLALVGFRILWGFVGTHYARFSSFLFSPRTIIDYVKGHPKSARVKYLGHNPAGSLSVFALLAIVLMQTISGLLANDDIANEGPLVKFVSKDFSDKITWFHSQVSGNLIYALVGLHILAIAYYFFKKKENLIKPMITGNKSTDGFPQAAVDSARTRLLAAIVFSGCAGGVYYVVHL